MKKIIAVLLALCALLSMAGLSETTAPVDPPAGEPPLEDAAASPAAGDWYANVEGVPLRLTLNADGSYEAAWPSAIADTTQGTWELRDGFVWLDGDGALPFNLVSTELMIWTADDTFFTRQVPETYASADVLPDAPLEMYEGYWKCAYVDADGACLPAEALDESTDIYVDTTTVALGGPRFGDIFWDFHFRDSVFSGELDDGRTITLAYQADGLLCMTIAGSDGETVLYLASADFGALDDDTE